MTPKTEAYQVPQDARGAIPLLTRDLDVTTLLPHTRVLCINRGRQPLLETFDGVHVLIPPGYFETEYGAALHFQRRQIVRGTKHLETGGYQSWIGILGTPDGRVKVNEPELCRPYTDDELQAFGEKLESFDRSGRDAGVTVKRVSALGASVPAMLGAARRGPRGIDISEQASPAAAEAAEHILDKPEFSETRAAEAEAAAEADAEVPVRRGRR